MLINTRDFGEIEITREDIIVFPAGVFAFEDARNFALLSPLGEDVYPKWLQCTDDVSPCFIVFDPFSADEEYIDNVKLEQSDAKTLKIDTESADNINVRLLVIATVCDDFKKTTVNMRAPIVINTDNGLATQVILPQSSDYDFKFPLFDEDEKEGKSC